MDNIIEENGLMKQCSDCGVLKMKPIFILEISIKN